MEVISDSENENVQVQVGTFLSLVFLHHVNNIEHNIKQNI